MTSDKWKLVGGRVYRLAGIFEKMADAITFARTLRHEMHVFLSKTTDGRWGVYWRSKEDSVECTPQYYSFA
jgi:hypothetical protein